MSSNVRCICIFVIICFLIGSFCSCRVKAEYKFHQDKEDIEGIYIVSLHFDTDTMEIYTNDIKRIENIDLFLQDFNDLDCYIWWGDPLTLKAEPDGRSIIKIVYSNGNYELIDWDGQAAFVFDNSNKHTGIRIFDEKQFNNLIEKYVV